MSTSKEPTLSAQESGHLSGGILCRYHAWSYGFNGDLIGAPKLLSLPNFDRDCYRLEPVRLTEWAGYVWLNLNLEAAPLAEQIDPQLIARFGDGDTLARYQPERLRIGGYNKIALVALEGVPGAATSEKPAP